MEDAIKPKKETDNKTLTYEEQVERDLMSDGFDIANNKVMDKARMNVLSMRSHDNEINAINAELNNIIRSMDADNTSNILRLSDLLELFQSPVHIKNRLIIATTNHFDKIKNVLPQLFRSGRLSGIELSYLDWDSLNELTQYYFKQPMNHEEFKITIPTSEVIELAIKYTLSKKPFEQFKQELFYKCSLV
jgi:predicted nucleotidyltransferase